MAETGARRDPFLAFRFEVTLDDLVTGAFSECSGLQLEMEVAEHPEGGVNDHVHKFPSRTKQPAITLKRGIVDRGLWDWYYQLTQGQVRLRDGTIAVWDPGGREVVMEWQFRGAFPSKWQGPELNAGQSMIAVETLELAHQGLDRRR